MTTETRFARAILRERPSMDLLDVEVRIWTVVQLYADVAAGDMADELSQALEIVRRSEAASRLSLDLETT